MTADPSEIWKYLDKGGATLLAALVSAALSCCCLLISIWSSRALARLSGRVTDEASKHKEAREYKLKQLTLFYDPIYALLSANKRIFERIGPASQARREGMFDDEETATVWAKLAHEVIVPNNTRICEIIERNLHFRSEGDDESVYLEFMTHAHAYKVFEQEAYEAHSLFPYPREFYQSVCNARSVVYLGVKKLYELEKS